MSMKPSPQLDKLTKHNYTLFYLYNPKTYLFTTHAQKSNHPEAPKTSWDLASNTV
jgi:hypothetical protein